MNRQQHSGEKRGSLAQTGLTLLCVTMAKCLHHTPSAFASLSCSVQKVFYLILHQPVSPGCPLHQAGWQQGDTPGSNAHTAKECARRHVYKIDLLCGFYFQKDEMQKEKGEKNLDICLRNNNSRSCTTIILSNCYHGELSCL